MRSFSPLAHPIIYSGAVIILMIRNHSFSCYGSMTIHHFCYLLDKTSSQFPHQINWHTDQSYRRPPPDITLLLAMQVPPSNQGQTLFADCTAAFAALDPELQQELKELQGIHAPSWIGRSREAVENGEAPLDLLPHQLPQRHPLVRQHPVTGEYSLFRVYS